MARKRPAKLVGLVALAGAALWACSKDYKDDGATPPTVDAGVTRDAAAVVVPTNGPGITISEIVVPRGEHAAIDFLVNRDGHKLPLVVVANNVPPNVTISAATLAEGEIKGTLDVAAGATAVEGTTSVELALLEGNDKIATAVAALEVAPFRPGTLDPTFGTDGFVDLGAPVEQTLLAFGTDGSLYVNALPFGLSRWTKDGVHDPSYGPLEGVSDRLTLFTMAGTDSGQLYVAGALRPGGVIPGANAIVLRTTADGKSFDSNWGNAGSAFPPTEPASNGTFNAVGIGITPTAIYSAVKVEDNGGSAGPTTVARLTLAGAVDTTYGTNGYTTLPIAYGAPEGVIFRSIGENHFFLAGPTVPADNPFLYLLETNGSTVTVRLGAIGTATAMAADATGTYFARALDGGTTLLRLGDAGADPSFAIPIRGDVHTISMESGGRPIVTACGGTTAAWTRYFPDAGVDSTYRNDTTSELTCILAAQVTEKYIYVAGPGGATKKLRMARLVR